MEAKLRVQTKFFAHITNLQSPIPIPILSGPSRAAHTHNDLGVYVRAASRISDNEIHRAFIRLPTPNPHASPCR